MIKPEDLNSINTEDGNALEKSNKSNGGKSLRDFFRAINVGVPLVEFVLALLGIVISLYIIIIINLNTQHRLGEMEKSINSLNMVIDSFKVHASRKHEINSPKRTDLKYDTIIIPHSIIEELNKLKTPGNPK